MNPADPPLEPEPDVVVERRRTRPAILVPSLLLLAVAALGLYEIASRGGKRAAYTGACAQSLDVARAVDPLVRGEVAALTVATAPNALGAVAFDDADGRETKVAAFKGKTILLNLWATWCAPCRAEMPGLDRLQATVGSPSFAVIPVNVDTARLDRPRPFLREIGGADLPFYADASADILRVLRAKGLPTTVLIGKDGCEIGTMAGPAQWDSPDAKALIEKLAGAPSRT